MYSKRKRKGGAQRSSMPFVIYDRMKYTSEFEKVELKTSKQNLSSS